MIKLFRGAYRALSAQVKKRFIHEYIQKFDLDYDFKKSTKYMSLLKQIYHVKMETHYRLLQPNGFM